MSSLHSSPFLPILHLKTPNLTPSRRLFPLKIPSSPILSTIITSVYASPTSQATLSEPDGIAILNDLLRRDHRHRRSSIVDSEEAERYIRIVKDQQQRGLKKLKGDRAGTGNQNGFGYRVDPYTLKSGDYVVHHKVGIGRFVGIKFDISKGESRSIEYVFIEYADGMAKLPVKQASRMLYRYSLSVALAFCFYSSYVYSIFPTLIYNTFFNTCFISCLHSPNETKKPRALSKLNDTTAWERRRMKGKIAIQRMVVDLMELYMHRLKQKRPPYPKHQSLIEFAAQFPYEPTPDQKQVRV